MSYSVHIQSTMKERVHSYEVLVLCSPCCCLFVRASKEFRKAFWGQIVALTAAKLSQHQIVEKLRISKGHNTTNAGMFTNKSFSYWGTAGRLKISEDQYECEQAAGWTEQTVHCSTLKPNLVYKSYTTGWWACQHCLHLNAKNLILSRGNANSMFNLIFCSLNEVDYIGLFFCVVHLVSIL